MLKTYFSLVFIIILSVVTGACGNAQNSASSIKHVGVEEFSQGLNQEDVILLDVRTPKEVKQGYIQGAKAIDFYAASFDKELANLDTTQTVYVYCRSGGRSAKAAEKLEELGFQKVVNLNSGIGAWAQAGKPITK